MFGGGSGFGGFGGAGAGAAGAGGGGLLSFLGAGNGGAGALGGAGSWLSGLLGMGGGGSTGPSIGTLNFTGPGATSFGTSANSMYAYPGAPGPGPYAIPAGTPAPSAADLTTVPGLGQPMEHATPYAAPAGYGPGPGTQAAASATGGIDWSALLQQAARSSAGKAAQGGMAGAMGLPPEVVQAITQALQAAHARRLSLIASMLGGR